MNGRRWIHTILGLMGVAVVTATLIQTRQVFTLQAEARQLREQTEHPPAEVVHTVTDKPVTDADANLNPEEQMELMRLRGEFARLHQRQRELGPLQAENKALLARITAAQANAKPGAIAVPLGYIQRKDARFAGYGTPDAALESLFWATANRDTNTLLHLMPHLTNQIYGAEAEKYWKQIQMVPGFRILKNETQSDSGASLTIEILPGDEVKIEAHKNGEEWQLDGF
jgi:hypothetical protein